MAIATMIRSKRIKRDREKEMKVVLLALLPDEKVISFYLNSIHSLLSKGVLGFWGFGEIGRAHV